MRLFFLQSLLFASLLSSLVAFSGCGTLRTEHKVTTDNTIRIDANINLRVSRELDDFFGELDAKNPVLNASGDEAGKIEDTETNG
jgi:hypothetical protein